MNLFIDESGSFAPTTEPHSWCFVGCFASSDNDYNKSQSILRNLKKSLGHKSHTEIGLGDIPEQAYLDFLSDLGSLGATFYAVGTDSASNTPSIVNHHRSKQADSIIEHIDKMNFDEGKAALRSLRERVLGLSHQLYCQLFCQLDLIYRTSGTTIPYYIQRDPLSLSHFKWRIDRKSDKKTKYEEAFEILGPEIIQTRSLIDPLIMIEGYDYSAMKKYFFTPETTPTYLHDAYGFPASKGGVNVGKMLREDMLFDDSRQLPGLQIADLLTNGLRRCFRQGFSDNLDVAEKLGKIMVQGKDGQLPFHLITMAPDMSYEGPVAEIAERIRYFCKPFQSLDLLRRASR